MKALVVEHDHVSPSGPVGERFQQRGYEITRHLVVPAENFHDPGVSTPFPDFTDYDVVVLLGAPWSVYDEATVGSWVEPELEQVRKADEAGVPVLGICFGGQLLATAHGGSVGPSDSPEIGWVEVESDSDLVPAGQWFQWHFDRWVVPPEAREIARNGAASQSFVLRRNLAVQFHPELNSAGLKGWLDNDGDANARENGRDPEVLMADTIRLDDDNERRAHTLVDNFLDRVATGAEA